MQGNELIFLYKERFSEKDRVTKNLVWKILCDQFFSKYIDSKDVVLDIGAGYCEFINNIIAQKKIAVDINPEIKNFARKDVEILNISGTQMDELKVNTIDVIFMSNFLEHLQDKEDVFLTLKECFRILKDDGKLIVMGPNIKYLYKEYWDFFDHKVPLSDLCLREILSSIGFGMIKTYGRFLPFSTKGGYPKFDFLIKLYLHFPSLWKIFGKQFLIICKK